jgi:hypothetical protein
MLQDSFQKIKTTLSANKDLFTVHSSDKEVEFKFLDGSTLTYYPESDSLTITGIAGYQDGMSYSLIHNLNPKVLKELGKPKPVTRKMVKWERAGVDNNRTGDTMMSSAISKLAKENPVLRKQLVPMMKQAYSTDIQVNIQGKSLSDILDQAKWAICHRIVDSVKMDIMSEGYDYGKEVDGDYGDGITVIKELKKPLSVQGVNIEELHIQYGIPLNSKDPSLTKLTLSMLGTRPDKRWTTTNEEKYTINLDKLTSDQASKEIARYIKEWAK